MPTADTYTEETGVALCSHLAGGASIAVACEHLGIGPATVYRWLAKYSDLREKYMRARDMRADARFERIDQILLDMRAGTIDASQARVEIDTVKWQCGKEAAKKYGDRLELAGDPDAPLISWADTLRARRAKRAETEAAAKETA